MRPHSNFNRTNVPAFIIVAGFLVIACARASESAPSLVKQLNEQLADVADRVSQSVVVISVDKPNWGVGDDFAPESMREYAVPPRSNARRHQPEGQGSGFIIRKDGYILTNNHVVEGASQIRVKLKNGNTHEASLRGRDDKTDLAVIKIEANDLTPAPLSDSDKVRVGELVMAIGAPYSLDYSVTVGVVSQKNRSGLGVASYEDFIQTDAKINPGNSGGPLVNLRGEVVGINTAIASRSGGSQGVGFAIPVNMATRIVEQLRETGKVTRAWLGVGIQELTPELARGLDISTSDGILVNDIFADGPAARAGFEEGDVILSMNGQPAESVAKFRNRVAGSRPGERVRFEILRDGKRRDITLELAEKTDAVVASATQPRRSDVESGLGLELANLTPDLAQRFGIEARGGGIVVVTVQEGSPAAEADLRPGDVVRVVNRRRVASVADFSAALSRLDAQDPVVLLVRRGERSFYATLTRTS